MSPACIPSPLPGDLGTGILHLGLGAFHRAHQAAFTEDAIAAGGGDWGIEAVSMRNPDLAEVLNAQGGRYSLIERHPDGPRCIEISVIRKAHCLATDPGAVADRLADPAIRIVTITVTEKGYGFDPATRRLDPAHPAIAHDLAHPGEPKGLIGLIVEGLSRRRAAGGEGMTLISCDNLTGNGHLLAGLVAEFARRRDPALADWIAAACRFPDSMIDRITPAATAETRAMAEAATGRPDRAAVETEPFRQWVIEDSFAGPRPAWEKAGVLIVQDVAPFELMKLRLLNGAHSMVAYLGAIAGLSFVRDVMDEPRLRALTRTHMAAAAETLKPLPGFDYDGYADALIERFSNPAIDHRCLQIAMDGSQKLPQRIFAPAADRLAAGRDIGTFALATAAWLRFLEGRTDTGQPLDLNDPLADALRQTVAASTGTAADLVERIGRLQGLGGREIFESADWTAAVAGALTLLRAKGVIGAIREADPA